MEEILDRQEHYLLKRDGRFLVAALRTPHQVLSTSVCSGGMTDSVRFLVNHQSVEGQGHLARFEWMKEIGEDGIPSPRVRGAWAGTGSRRHGWARPRTCTTRRWSWRPSRNCAYAPS